MKKAYLVCGGINDTYDGIKQGRTKRVFSVMGGLYMEITKMDLFRILQGIKNGILLTIIAF